MQILLVIQEILQPLILYDEYMIQAMLQYNIILPIKLVKIKRLSKLSELLSSPANSGLVCKLTQHPWMAI